MRNGTMGAALCAVCVVAAGCGTLNGARPLDDGQHVVGATFGGPVLMALGPPIPVPNLVVEGRSGLPRLWDLPLDVNYGLNLTAAAFGVMGVHGGVSMLVIDGDGWTPSLAVTERLYLNHNYFDLTKEAEARDFSLVEQGDVTLGWRLGNHLLYSGLGLYFDFGAPSLLLGPFLGTEIRPGGASFHMQVEVRHMGATFDPEISDVEFLSPGTGVISFTFSVGWTLGEKGGAS